MKKIIFLFIGMMGFSLLTLGQQIDNVKLLEQMVEAIEKAERLKFRFIQKERVRKGWNEAIVDIKYQVEPQKIYIKCIEPNEGVELLLVDGKYDGYVYVNPNGFPFINLKLNQYGFLLLGNQKHHPIESTGYGLFYDVVKDYLNQTALDDILTFEGMVTFDNRTCYHLQLKDPSYTFIDYTIQKGDNILKIARSRHIADYIILEKNPELSDYFDVKEGQVIQIPTTYSPQAILYLDAVEFLPLMLEMSDDKGLYERYEFLDLEVNPNFQAQEFSEDFVEYGF